MRAPRLLLVNVAVFAGLVVTIDVVARLVAPRDLSGIFEDPDVFLRGRPFVIPDPNRGFALNPGYSCGIYHINSDGFRGTDLPDPLTDAKLLAVGDSGTFGWNVEGPATYPSALQVILDGKCGQCRKTLVINAGVPSYTSSQCILYLRELLPRYHPQQVIVSVFWNDVLCSMLPNWIPEYLVIQQPAPWRQFLLRHSGFYRALLIKQARGRGLREAAMNLRAVRYYGANLHLIAAECRRSHAEVVYLAPSLCEERLPLSIELQPGDRVKATSLIQAYVAFKSELVAAATRDDIVLIPHRLQDEAGDCPEFIDFMHPSASGYQVLAEDIAANWAYAAACPP